MLLGPNCLERNCAKLEIAARTRTSRPSQHGKHNPEASLSKAVPHYRLWRGENHEATSLVGTFLDATSFSTLDQ